MSRKRKSLDNESSMEFNLPAFLSSAESSDLTVEQFLTEYASSLTKVNEEGGAYYLSHTTVILQSSTANSIVSDSFTIVRWVMV